MNYSEILEALLDIINFLIDNGIEILALALSFYIFRFDKRESNKQKLLLKFDLEDEFMRESKRALETFHKAMELSSDLNDPQLFKRVVEIDDSGRFDLPEWVENQEKREATNIEKIKQDLQKLRTAVVSIHIYMMNAQKRKLHENNGEKGS